MRQPILYTCASFLCLLFLAGCEMQNEFTDSPRQNFEVLWKTLDEHYCFFEYKEVDWEAVYREYSQYVDESLNSYELYNILSDMLNELKDGHINLITPERVSRYDNWFLDYSLNFNEVLIADHYFQGNYNWGSTQMQSTFLREGQIGYIYYPTFTEGVLESELDQLLLSFADCEGLIIDVRNNAGGSLTHSDRLASRFVKEKTLTAYIQHKTGKGHTDFSNPYPIYLHPSEGVLWLRPVMVLTNRRAYSATNNFVSKLKVLPQVTMIGDWTGGGSGFPITSELPNGWSVRFPTSPILDINKQHTEFGIAPDIEVALDPAWEEEGRDALIEKAIEMILYPPPGF